MKCEKFEAWLENRDMHDVSEADKAYRHAEDCSHCCQLLKNDESLDRFIADSLCCEPMPSSLKNTIDLSLDRAIPGKSKKGILAAVALCFVLVIAVFTFNQEQQRFVTMDEMSRFMQADFLDHGQVTAIYDPVGDPGLWLSEHSVSEVQPPMTLLAGYSVKGARFCQLGHCRAVHMLYEKDGKLVSVFVVGEDEVGFHMEKNRLYSLAMGGNSVKLYRQGKYVYALVV